MIQTEQSATLGVSQDQTLFAPNRSVGVDTYNQNITGDVAATLNATSCDSPSHSGPSVLAYAFEPGISKRGNVENRIVEEKTPTLRAKMGDNQIATAYGLGRDSFNSGTNAQFTMSIEEETQPPITERGAGGGMLNNTVNALCRSDYKGIGNQYVNDGKVILEPHHDTPNR